MKWYLNMKIGKKLVTGFILVALIGGAMGMYGIYNLKDLSTSDMELYQDMTIPVELIGKISMEFQGTRVDARNMIIAQTPEQIQASIDSITERRGRVDALTKQFEKLIYSDEIKAAYAEYQTTRVDFKKNVDSVIELAKQNKDAEAVTLMSAAGQSGIASKAYQDAVEKLVDLEVAAAEKKATTNANQAAGTIRIMMIVILLTMGLSILVGILISSVIKRPLKKSLHMIRK